MRATTTLAAVCAALAITVDASAQAAGSFRPERRLFGRLFTGVPRLRAPAPVETRSSERERPANRECDGCEERPGAAHLVMDSPRLTNGWLDRHTYQANGGSFGDNLAVADFWYDAVHRRFFTRSLVLHEVDDPADLRLGRAPGRYPNDIDVNAELDSGTTVGHVGFVRWSHNGFGSYFAAVQGAVRDVATGYLDLATATGTAGTTRTGSTYDGQDLIKHVRLHPSGQLEVGFETNAEARPDFSLLVRGNARVEGTLDVHRLEAESLVVGGGALVRACALRTATTRGSRSAAHCDSGQLALSGGGTCESGELRGSRPLQSADVPDGWELTCSKNGSHTAYVVCCAQ